MMCLCVFSNGQNAPLRRSSKVGLLGIAHSPPRYNPMLVYRNFSSNPCYTASQTLRPILLRHTQPRIFFLLRFVYRPWMHSPSQLCWGHSGYLEPWGGTTGRSSQFCFSGPNGVSLCSPPPSLCPFDVYTFYPLPSGPSPGNFLET